MWALSNLKNSLKSGGRWIVAIDNLTHQFGGLQTFVRAFGKPMGFLVRRLQKRCGGKGRPVQLGRIYAVHHSQYTKYPSAPQTPNQPRSGRCGGRGDGVESLGHSGGGSRSGTAALGRRHLWEGGIIWIVGRS